MMVDVPAMVDDWYLPFQLFLGQKNIKQSAIAVACCRCRMLPNGFKQGECDVILWMLANSCTSWKLFASMKHGQQLDYGILPIYQLV